MSLAYLGAGTLLKIGNAASPEVFNTVSETVAFDLGEESALEDVTHLESVALEYISKLPDGVQFTATANHIPTNAQQVAMLAARAARTVKNFKVVLPPAVGSLTYSFAALVLGWKLNFDPNTAVKIVFTCKVTGGITGPV